MAVFGFVVFVALALFCLDVFGLITGSLIWLACYALFWVVHHTLLRIVGDPSDVYDQERR